MGCDVLGGEFARVAWDCELRVSDWVCLQRFVPVAPKITTSYWRSCCLRAMVVVMASPSWES